jgi:hypothetical protein
MGESCLVVALEGFETYEQQTANQDHLARRRGHCELCAKMLDCLVALLKRELSFVESFATF